MYKRIGFFLPLLLMFIVLISAISVESQLPPLIRLHVLANSDSAEDQELKYKVRDRVISVMKDKFSDSKSLEESRQILLESLPLLEDSAEEVIQAAGATYSVQAQHGEYDFPTKYYGSFALPAGRYEALRLVIGQGQGANWWCVLFPPLCIVDGKTIKDKPKADLTKEIVDNIPQGKIIKIKPAFKVVEVWKEVVSKAATK